ncbi:MAG: orotidine-5'-phosphate decarboxylase [Candidatus Micrarchaeaceae archaeon]
MPEESRIIVALDMVDPVFARELAKKTAGEVFAIKIGWPLILNSNADIINDLSRYSKVICDMKIADIPFTNELITRKARDNGAWGVIAHSFLGKDSLEAVVKSAGDMKVFSVVSMSHPGSSYMLDRRLKELIRLSIDCKVYGIVAPGNRPEILKKARKFAGSLKIISPGIGFQGGDSVSAISSGADYVIVGRSVTNADDPTGEVKKINYAVSHALRG